MYVYTKSNGFACEKGYPMDFLKRERNPMEIPPKKKKSNASFTRLLCEMVQVHHESCVKCSTPT